MTEPVTAADVMRLARLERWERQGRRSEVLLSVDDEQIAALREACGGGDVVITASGALATLEAVEWEYGKPSEFRLVPVERGA